MFLLCGSGKMSLTELVSIIMTKIECKKKYK